MYTVLLADDEEEAIKVIVKKIDWEALGFSVIGSADNGVKALEMVEESQPDVLVTDIKMPYMDGMELSDRVKTAFPATKILLFTGFDEFEYAKEAIHLEVEEYILKPVNSVELTDSVVNEIVADIKTSVPAQEGGQVYYPGERALKSIQENRRLGIPVVEEIWNAVLAM
jgi:YesN/AraC family two-component response regulator